MVFGDDLIDQASYGGPVADRVQASTADQLPDFEIGRAQLLVVTLPPS